MVFAGTFEHTIDAKSRVAIPAQVRAQVGKTGRNGKAAAVRFWVAMGERGSLCLYTPSAFKVLSAELARRPDDTDELDRYERYFYSLATEVEMDSAGRIRLPETLIKLAKLDKDVVLIGVNDRIEIRDRQTWLDSVVTELEENPDLMISPRRAMSRSRRLSQADGESAVGET